MFFSQPKKIVGLMGPAFVAAIAYVDPGNVASNVSAGSQYGYLLVWVLVLACVVAMMVQYQSAKLGLVTGKSLPEHLGERLRTPSRIAFWIQAELVSIATDLAEVVGGAIALNLLFNLPLLLGGCIIGAVSIVLLLLQNPQQQRHFEFVIIGLLLIIAVGFTLGNFIIPPSLDGVTQGLIPRFHDSGSVLLGVSMIGATVMPHIIYLHSGMINDRHGTDAKPVLAVKSLLRASRWDVGIALSLAGAVNVGLLLLAATSLYGKPNTDTIDGAAHAITDQFGSVVGTAFALGVLASGLASTSVGAYAGSTIMSGMLNRRVSLLTRRLITIIPALIVLYLKVDPTEALVISQVVLSFGLPFVLIPLLRYTANRSLMGEFIDGLWLKIISWTSVTAILVLNGVLIYLTFTGAA